MTVLVAVIVALVAVTATVLIMAPRGREAVEASPEVSSSSAPATTDPSAASPSPSVSQVTADGCLGGAVELNRAIVSAQEQAPLTAEGAAAFTATLLRWTSASPAPAYKADTATQVLAQDATTLVQDWVASQAPANVTTAADLSSGRFYIESYSPTRAVVSYIAAATGTQDGVELVPATISGAVTLVAQNGTWHLQNLTSERDVSDLQAVSSPYTGGC
ncbi:hypothetical protein [Kineococcus sp. R86509]|uniref:hypothetical protein n=1 Tax=Kineococcus sp. R86509 TaxID=3093851 RepID=UPI0036D35014